PDHGPVEVPADDLGGHLDLQAAPRAGERGAWSGRRVGQAGAAGGVPVTARRDRRRQAEVAEDRPTRRLRSGRRLLLREPTEVRELEATEHVDLTFGKVGGRVPVV